MEVKRSNFEGIGQRKGGDGGWGGKQKTLKSKSLAQLGDIQSPAAEPISESSIEKKKKRGERDKVISEKVKQKGHGPIIHLFSRPPLPCRAHVYGWCTLGEGMVGNGWTQGRPPQPCFFCGCGMQRRR